MSTVTWSNYHHNDEVHTVPNDDALAHEFHDCACVPEVEPVPRDDGSMGWLYIHHAWDERP